jgi:SAM-dependent methyltransferase
MDTVQDHYDSQNLSQRIQNALKESGKDISAILPKDLAAVDQLHTGGALTTLGLMAKAGYPKKNTPSQDVHILDAGCGLGGSARLLCKTFPCRVTGIDLAASFIETARELTGLCNLSHCIEFEQGSVLTMPFENDSFDAILCQHILMNIQDKETALKEFYRVLKPGKVLILHEIFQGENRELALPVPWASDPCISFLLPWEEFDSLLIASGFTRDHFSDETQTALAWWQMVHGAGKNKSPRPLSPALVFGSNAAFFPINMQKNFQNNSLQCIEAIYKKS